MSTKSDLTGKRKHGEDPLKKLDARTLSARFKSKTDLYQYCNLQRKRSRL